jgi:hypothetical protein
MNAPNFKTILQKLSVFKNNLSLLVPVIIGLLSVLLFIPTQLMSSKLRERVAEESIRKAGNRIPSLIESAVSRKQWEVEAERQQDHANDANEIANLAEQSTRRALLSYDVFPEPDPNGFSGLLFQEFGQRFRSAMDELIVRFNGRDCPSEAELERALENSSVSSRTRGRWGSMMPSASGGSPSGRLGTTRMLNSIQRMIVDQVCQERAESISFYANPADLSGYEYWADYKYDVNMVEAVEDSWYHQLAYWVIEDIFDTINTVNSGHDNVLAAPAKRFLRITFTMGLQRPGSRGGVFTGRRKQTQKTKVDADRPSYVLSAADGLTEPCTGRFSGNDIDDIDVIHFNFAVVVSTKAILPFMQQLCSAKQHIYKGYPDGQEQPQTFKHNQITILENKIGAVNRQDQIHRNYKYGEDSVVELDLICEYVFNKKGYEQIKPESVKTTLAGQS